MGFNSGFKGLMQSVVYIQQRVMNECQKGDTVNDTVAGHRTGTGHVGNSISVTCGMSFCYNAHLQFQLFVIR